LSSVDLQGDKELSQGIRNLVVDKALVSLLDFGGLSKDLNERLEIYVNKK